MQEGSGRRWIARALGVLLKKPNVVTYKVVKWFPIQVYLERLRTLVDFIERDMPSLGSLVWRVLFVRVCLTRIRCRCVYAICQCRRLCSFNRCSKRLQIVNQLGPFAIR